MKNTTLGKGGLSFICKEERRASIFPRVLFSGDRRGAQGKGGSGIGMHFFIYRL